MHGRWRDGRSFDPGWMKDLHLARRFHGGRGSYGIASFAVDRAFDLGYGAAEAARFRWVARPTEAPPRDRPPRPGERA